MKLCKMMVPAIGLGLFAAVPAHAQDDMMGESPAVVQSGPAEVATPTDPYAGGSDAEGFESFESRVCYAIGANIGAGMTEQFAQVGFEFDIEAFTQAFRDAAGEGETKLTTQQVEATLLDFQQQMQVMQFEQMEKMQAEMEAQGEENALAGAAFLEKNKDADGVQTTESGLQYALETKGDGPTPGPGDTVLVHYEGKLLDGTVFDSSIERGEPVPFPMDHVIPGFSEGLALMPVGSEGTLFIPGELAYGVNPPPGSEIGFNETLTFKVQVLEMVEDVDDPAPAEAADAVESTPREPLAD